MDHRSDCALHNEPAILAGPCDCGATYTTEYIVSLHGDPVWQAIWDAIKGWDISRTQGSYSYHAPTGDDATRIYEAVKAAQATQRP